MVKYEREMGIAHKIMGHQVKPFKDLPAVFLCRPL